MSEKYFSLAKRNSKELFVIAMDLDNFKQINDKYGHQVGDEVLRRFSKNCKQQFRDSDVFARMGGEEFSAVLYDIEFKEARAIANRILKTSAQLVIEYENTQVSFTISIGISSIRISDKNLDDIIYRADNALYKAKEKGRNQVVLT